MRFLVVLIALACADSASEQTELDSVLVAELAEIHDLDQDGRMEWMRRSYDGPVPDSVHAAFWDVQRRIDADNLARVEAIIEAHGWPGES